MKKSGCFTLILFVALCGSLLANLLLFAAITAKGSGGMAGVRMTGPKTFEEQVVEEGGSTSSKIAVIPIEGIIAFGQESALGESMIDDLRAAFEQAALDSDVKAVVLQIDSPGGEITASDVLYDAVCRLARKKPVVAYFNALGASGAYYTACGANWMMANYTTFTGSIGVIISTLNYRELFGKIGLESVTFKSGKFKDMLSGSRELTPEEKEYVQGLVMQSYERFLGIVSRARRIDADTLRNGPADGRILSGADAFAEGLLDQVGYIEEAFEKARELGEAPEAAVVRYERSYDINRLFRLFGESSARGARIELDVLKDRVQLEPGRIYLLPPFFAP